jgi:hypothetical protein
MSGSHHELHIDVPVKLDEVSLLAIFVADDGAQLTIYE